jgi:hypothetical protein
MRDFKFFNKNDNNFSPVGQFLRLQPLGQILRPQPQVRYEDVEFCFQFGENEPVPFMSGSEFCQITLDNTSEGNMTFTDNSGDTFKLFARERI